MTAEKPTLDPFTFEILRHKFWQITDEMGATLIHTSGSPVVTEVMDIATAIFSPEGAIISMGNYVMLHMVSMQMAVKAIIAECGQDPGISENDMFILNDPYRGTLHQPDVVIVAPIHYNGELIGWAGCMCHELDIGGMVPGGIASGAREVYQEGLRLPPVKLIEAGKLRKDIWNAIMNNIRLAEVGLDFKAQIASNNVAKRRMREICDSYGVDTVKAMMDEVLAYSEGKLRERLRQLPDGVFRHADRMDHDGLQPGIHEVFLTLTKKGDSLIFDYTGTSPQAEGFINCCLGGAWGGTYDSLLTWLCYDMPWNAGLLRPVTVIAPEGTLCNPRLPAPVSMASVGTAWAIRNASEAVLSKMLACSPEYWPDAMGVWHGSPYLLIISGRNQFGEPFGYIIMDPIAGGCGAKAGGDGVDSCGDANCCTVAMPNVEVHEASNPILFLSRRQLKDSGGPGKYRGGMGIEEMIVPYGVERLHLTTAGHGTMVPRSAGIFGGYPGSCNYCGVANEGSLPDRARAGTLPQSFQDLTGEIEALPACVPSKWLGSHQVIYYRCGGGGGYGDPLERAPELVLQDFVDEKVSLECAREVYGVVLDPARGVVDLPATDAQRRALRESRVGSVRPSARPEPGTGARMGEYLVTVQVGDQEVVRCAKCGHQYGTTDESVKLHASMREVPLTNAGPLFPGPEQTDFFLREFYCPECATCIEVEVAYGAAGPVHDICLSRAVGSEGSS